MSRLDQIRRMSDDDLILFLRRYNRQNRGGIIFSPRIQYALFG